MSDFMIQTNAADVSQKLDRLNDDIKFSLPLLWQQIGPRLVDDVRNRITTQDGGRWADLSKWVKAKKTVFRALQGTEQYVKWKQSGDGMVVYGDMPSDWTFTQHHDGFENKEDHKANGRITIDIVNPGPLGRKSAGPFSWIPTGETFRTPARQIWPTNEQARTIVLPIASRWLESVVNRAEQPA